MPDQPKCLSPQHHRAECECGLLHTNDVLAAEVERLRAKQTELNRRVQAAEAAMRDLLACNEKLASGSAWCGGSLGRAFLAYANTQIRADRDRLSAENAEFREKAKLVVNAPNSDERYLPWAIEQLRELLARTPTASATPAKGE